MTSAARLLHPFPNELYGGVRVTWCVSWYAPPAKPSSMKSLCRKGDRHEHRHPSSQASLPRGMRRLPTRGENSLPHPPNLRRREKGRVGCPLQGVRLRICGRRAARVCRHRPTLLACSGDSLKKGTSSEHQASYVEFVAQHARRHVGGFYCVE